MTSAKYTRVRGPVYGGEHFSWPDLPLGCPHDITLIAGETPEQRTFRRFPIAAHKPCDLKEWAKSREAGRQAKK